MKNMDTTAPALDPAKLDKAKPSANGKTIAACPACREIGRDKSGNHLCIEADGRFGCAAFPGDAEHRKRIFALAGSAPEPKQKKPQTWKTLAEAATAITPEGFRPWGVYYYGDEVAGVARYENDAGEKTFRQFHAVAGGWRTGGLAGPWPLYGDIPPAGPVVVVEGEKCADSLSTIDLCAVTSAGGSAAAHKTDWTPLAGREVWLFPDNDAAGEKYADAVAVILQRLDPPARVRTVRIEGLPEGGDVVNWIEQRDAIEPDALRAELVKLAESMPESRTKAIEGGCKDPRDILLQIHETMPPGEAEAFTPSGIVSLKDFMAEPVPEPPQVIRDVLRAGQIAVGASSSKGGKTWLMQSLGLAVATGKSWLAWKTTPGRVLFIDPELCHYDGQRRMMKLMEAMGLKGPPEGFDFWRVKGKNLTIADVQRHVLKRMKETGVSYTLIIVDSVYCFGGGRDENSNSEQAETMQELYTLSELSGAAVFITHHFSKGNKSQTDHLDRASGAGVFARAPDVFMTLTPHQEPDCYTVETTCRSFARPEPFVARWEYPLWKIDEALDPDSLKRPGSGRGTQFTPDQIMDLLPADGLPHHEWLAKANKELGISKATFNRLLGKAKAKGLAVCGFGRYVAGSGGE